MFSALPADRPLQWQGYIKDYDGGTLMECRIHPSLPYGSFPGACRLAVLSCAVL